MNYLSVIAAEQASDRALRADIHAYHDHLSDEEARAELRAEAVEQHTIDLLHDRSEFYPWSFDHYIEALDNAPEEVQEDVLNTLKRALARNLEGSAENRDALLALCLMVEHYWEHCARSAAEREARRFP